MSNTDKAMELVDKCIKTYALHGTSDVMIVDDGKAREEVRAHLEAMQKDCRTCGHYFGCCDGGFASLRHLCINHDKYMPVEFKQLTRSE